MNSEKDKETIPPFIRSLLDKIHSETGASVVGIKTPEIAIPRTIEEDPMEEFREFEYAARRRRDQIALSQGLQPENVRLVAVKIYLETDNTVEKGVDYHAIAYATMYKDPVYAKLLQMADEE